MYTKIQPSKAQTAVGTMIEQKKEAINSSRRGGSPKKPQQLIEEVVELEESSVKRNKQMDTSSEFITEIAKNLPRFFSRSEMTSQKLAEQLWKMQRSLQKNELQSLFTLSQLSKLYSRDWKYLNHTEKESLIANYIQNYYGLQQQIEKVQRQIEAQAQIQ